MPIARVLSIGDELLFGRTVDTNATHLCRLLGDQGLLVDRVEQVGDGEATIVAALRRACRGAALVVCTGGLGPTDDDRTRHALARLGAVALEERPAAWRAIRACWGRLRPGMAVPEVNRRQALFPCGAESLANDRGTAPGLLMRLPGGCWVACLPGVPHEMVAMADRLARRLPRLVPGLRRPVVAEAWFAGIGESTAQELLAGLFSEGDPTVGITVSELGHITLRVVGSAAPVRRRLAELRQRIEPYLLPHPDLAASLLGACAERGWTLAAAESCTAGHLAARLGAVPGASRCWRMGVVAYQPMAKRSLLAVPGPLIRRHGLVSAAVAEAMAAGMRRTARADLALATTGLAGPAGEPGIPVGTVWLAAATAAGAVSRQVRIFGGRERVQRRAAAAALQLGWEVVNGMLPPGRTSTH